MAWEINFSTHAERSLKKLDPQSKKLILDYLRHRIPRLEHPTKAGKALQSKLASLWRYRVGKFRIICRIDGNKLSIMVVAIGSRDAIYDELA